AVRSFGRCRSAMARLHRRDDASPSARTDDAASSRTREAPTNRECLSRAVCRRDAPSRLAIPRRPLQFAPPSRRLVQYTVVSEIEMQRRYRHVAVLDRAKVGVELARPAYFAAANPINLSPPRIF